MRKEATSSTNVFKDLETHAKDATKEIQKLFHKRKRRKKGAFLFSREIECPQKGLEEARKQICRRMKTQGR